MEARRTKQFPIGTRPHGNGIEIWFYWPKGSKKKVHETLNWASTPANIEKAGKLRKTITDEIKHGVFVYAEHFPDSLRAFEYQSGTFLHFSQSWLDSPLNKWTPQTRYKFKGILQNIWLPRLHDKLVHLISKTDLIDVLSESIKAFKEKYERENSISIYNDWLICVRGVFNQAIDGNAIKRTNNPAAELKNKTRNKTEPDPFVLDETDAIIADIYQHDGQIWGAWFELGFFSGLRYPSEPSALLWAAINLRNSANSPYGEMRITQIRSRHAKDGIQKTTKTGVARTVLLNSRSKQALLNLRQHTGFSDTWIFIQDNGNPVLTSEPQRAMWRASLKRLGLRYRDPYCMRHSYATLGLMAGNNPAFMAKQLGHSLEEFFRTYAKWIDITDNKLQMELMERNLKKQKVAGTWQESKSKC